MAKMLSASKLFPATGTTNFNNVFPATRYFNNICNHLFGSTPPEDYLQSITDDVEIPKVLILGCGDIRSCFYTLWNNFDPHHSRTFKGVHFTLNDSSAAVMARNVLFLYLCTQMPDDPEAVKKWIASFWSIWFCHELLPDHHKVLMDALSQLVKWSKTKKSWESLNLEHHPLYSLVSFSTPSTLEKLHNIWSMWHGKCNPNKLKAEHRDSTGVLVQCFGSVLFEKLDSSQRKVMEDEITSYYESGNVFAEKVLLQLSPAAEMLPQPEALPKVEKVSLEKSESLYCNNSFIERPDNKYTIPCTAIPYKCFYHSLQCFPKYLQEKEKVFTKQPLLASSVQQFSIWIQSCAKIFSNSQLNIKFEMECSEALEFCQVLRNCPRFDVVYSSNLMDFTAPPSLVILALSVVKDFGLLFATSFSARVFDSAQSYLKEMFGFDSKHLPVLIGARCINVEGEYSSKVCLKPVPYDPESSRTTFIWQRVTPTALTGLPEKNLGELFDKLCNAIVCMLGDPLRGGDKSCMISLMCTETAILMLQSFVAQLDPTCYDQKSYEFWEPLSSRLHHQKCMKAFYTSLQTHALLHGLHLHLKSSNKDCPMCKKTPITNFIKYCTIEVDHEGVDYNESRYVVVIHQSKQSFDMPSFWSRITSGHFNDVHVFDCLAGYEIIEGIVFNFVVPQGLLVGEYTSTVISINFNRRVPFSVVKSLDTQAGDYTGFEPLRQLSDLTQHSNLLRIGELSSHYESADYFESVISISDQALHWADIDELKKKFSSCTTCALQLLFYNEKISYPYPVSFEDVSPQEGRVVVKARRKRDRLYEECLAVLVNPDNDLTMPKTHFSPEEICLFSGFQYNQEDCMLMDKIESGQKKHISTEMKVKMVISHFLKQGECCIELVDQTSSESVVGLVAVHNQLFDVVNKTPASDLYFCFPTKEIYEESYQNWKSFCMRVGTTKDKIREDISVYQLLEKLLQHFASRTVTTSCITAMDGSMKGKLINCNIFHLFHRAVVYPLYLHKDAFADLQSSSQRKKCKSCDQCFVELKKCHRCAKCCSKLFDYDNFLRRHRS